MPEKLEVGFYEFIRSELGTLEGRIGGLLSALEVRTDRRFSEMEARTEKHFSEMEARTQKHFFEMEARTEKRFDQEDVRFNKLEEEVRWPRRIATAGVITTVIAVFFAIAGFTR